MAGVRVRIAGSTRDQIREDGRAVTRGVLRVPTTGRWRLLTDPLDRLQVEEAQVRRVGDRVDVPPPWGQYVQHTTRAQHPVTLVDQVQVIGEMLQHVDREDLVGGLVAYRQSVTQVRDDGDGLARTLIQTDVARILRAVAAADVKDHRVAPAHSDTVPDSVHAGEPAEGLAYLAQLPALGDLAGDVRNPAVKPDLDVEVA